MWCDSVVWCGVIVWCDSVWSDLNTVVIQDWYPAVTAGCLTSLYLMIYTADLTTLTLLSVVGLLLTLLDYLTPLVAAKVFPADSWSREKEKKLESLCRALVNTGVFLRSCWATYSQAKAGKPTLHFGATLILLLCSAYLGSLVSGMMLSYILLMVTLMLPGLYR